MEAARMVSTAVAKDCDWDHRRRLSSKGTALTGLTSPRAWLACDSWPCQARQALYWGPPMGRSRDKSPHPNAKEAVDNELSQALALPDGKMLGRTEAARMMGL